MNDSDLDIDVLDELRQIIGRRADAQLRRDRAVRAADAQLARELGRDPARQAELEATVRDWMRVNQHRLPEITLVHGEIASRLHPERVVVEDPIATADLARIEAPGVLVIESRLDLRRMAQLPAAQLAVLRARKVRGASLSLALPEGHVVTLEIEEAPCPAAP